MIQAVDKALRLLNAVSATGDWIGVRELARLTGLKPPTAQQLLKTLQARGYLTFEPATRRYRIGLGAAALARSCDLPGRLGALAAPHVQALHAAFGETSVALIVDRSTFLCPCACACTQELATALPSPADLAHPHIMACGLALLAWQDEPFLKAYLQAQRLAGRQAAALTTRLAAVCQAGYAELVDDRHSGVVAYGAPVLDAAGRPLLALGFSMPLARFTTTLGRRVLRRVLAEAEAMSRSFKEKSA